MYVCVFSVKGGLEIFLIFSACRVSTQVFPALIPHGLYVFKFNQPSGATGVEVV